LKTKGLEIIYSKSNLISLLKKKQKQKEKEKQSVYGILLMITDMKYIFLWIASFTSAESSNYLNSTFSCRANDRGSSTMFWQSIGGNSSSKTRYDAA